jgi:hypothetical protein
MKFCSLVCHVTAVILVLSAKAYIVQLYCTHLSQNALHLSLKLAQAFFLGLNLSYLLSVLCTKFLLDASTSSSGVGLVISGRIKGQSKTRAVASINALSIGSFTNTLLDIGIVASVSALGVVGIKLGLVL